MYNYFCLCMYKVYGNWTKKFITLYANFKALMEKIRKHKFLKTSLSFCVQLCLNLIHPLLFATKSIHLLSPLSQGKLISFDIQPELIV